MEQVKEKLKNKTLLTVYLNEKRAEELVNKLNAVHRRIEFEYKDMGDNVFEVYVNHNYRTDKDCKEHVMNFLLDRIAYNIN